jgi:hypothetical protein
MSKPEEIDVDAALDLRVDPVTEAKAYRAALLGLLGDRDPAEVQGELPDQVEAMIREAGPHLLTRPAAGEWSVLELVGHLIDAEIASSARYRWILAHDEPPLIGYDQDLWVARLRYQEDDPRELLSLLRALKRANLRLWSRTSAAERARMGMHAERGPESLDLTFRLNAGHGLFHLGQMRRTLAEVAEASV